MGGKCPTVILANFQKWEENVPPSFQQIFINGRKMSDGHSGNFSKTGGKCPTIILANFQNQEEFVCSSFWQTFKIGRKMFNSHSDNFSKIGGKCPIVILTIFQKQEEIVIWQFLWFFKNTSIRRKMSNIQSDYFSEKRWKLSLSHYCNFKKIRAWKISQGGKTTNLLGDLGLGSIYYQENFLPWRILSWRKKSGDNYLLGELNARRICCWEVLMLGGKHYG